MRALLSDRPGPPSALRLADVPEPSPATGQIRIAVRCCGLNYPDILMIDDRYQHRPQRPFAPGIEVTGVIDALGPGIEGFRTGERVLAQLEHGGLAEKALADIDRVHHLPDSVGFEAGAALLLAYGTSLHALRSRASIKAGERLLVLGASGGVGLAAVELGRAFGAHVVAAVSSEDKRRLALAHGAAEALVYPSRINDPRALLTLFRSFVPDGFDVVYDPVGGAYAEPAFRALGWRGRYLVVGFPAGIPNLTTNLALLKEAQVIGVFFGDAMRRDPGLGRALTSELFALYGSGAIRPKIGLAPLAEAPDALARLSARQMLGKSVITLV